MTEGMLASEKILVTGATGKIAFPIARALARDNEVWGAARLRDPKARDEARRCRCRTGAARREHR